MDIEDAHKERDEAFKALAQAKTEKVQQEVRASEAVEALRNLEALAGGVPKDWRSVSLSDETGSDDSQKLHAIDLKGDLTLDEQGKNCVELILGSLKKQVLIVAAPFSPSLSP